MSSSLTCPSYTMSLFNWTTSDAKILSKKWTPLLPPVSSQKSKQTTKTNTDNDNLKRFYFPSYLIGFIILAIIVALAYQRKRIASWSIPLSPKHTRRSSPAV